MKHINSADDMNAMLAAENAALFVWVHWSMYARHGSKIFMTAKSSYSRQRQDSVVSWFVADLSTPGATPVATSLHHWLKSQDKEGRVTLFPSIDMGNGSTVLIKNGKVVAFDPSALRSGVQGLTRSVEAAFDAASKAGSGAAKS